MPSVLLRFRQDECTIGETDNSLPQLLHTPAGLAIIEVQGTIHAPTGSPANEDDAFTDATEVGRLEFPLYDPDKPGEGPWMKKVYLYIGKYQRLSGEVKKLPKATLVVMKDQETRTRTEDVRDSEQERLDIVAIVKYKILFSNRPEPVGS